MFVCLWTKVGFCLSGVPPSQFCVSFGIRDKGKGGGKEKGNRGERGKGEQREKGQREKREKGEKEK